jgi:hypothetical protein
VERTPQATWKEARYRQLAAKPNAKSLVQSYSATGLRGPSNGLYSTSFFSCCNDPITLLYVLLCPFCARASAGAMAQGRATDVCDVILPPTVWQVRAGKLPPPPHAAAIDRCVVTSTTVVGAFSRAGD